jgi:anti-anti-sigma regulatory factor
MSNKMRLDKKLDVFNLSANQEQFDALVHVGEVTVDVSSLEQCDYLGIQMFLCFIKTVSRNGYKVHIENPNPVFTQALHVLGVESEFNII